MPHAHGPEKMREAVESEHQDHRHSEMHKRWDREALDSLGRKSKLAYRAEAAVERSKTISDHGARQQLEPRGPDSRC